MKLALVDNNKETLAVARSTLESDVDAEIFIADVADLERWKKLKVEIGQRFGAIHFLVLNAGTAARGGWEDVEHFHKVRIVPPFSKYLYPPPPFPAAGLPEH